MPSQQPANYRVEVTRRAVEHAARVMYVSLAPRLTVPWTMLNHSEKENWMQQADKLLTEFKRNGIIPMMLVQD